MCSILGLLLTVSIISVNPPSLEEIMISVAVTSSFVPREAAVRSRAGEAMNNSKGRHVPMESQALGKRG